MLLGLWIYLINVEAESKAEIYSTFVADIILVFNGRKRVKEWACFEIAMHGIKICISFALLLTISYYLGPYGQPPANHVIIRERYRDSDGDLALGMLAGAATGMALGSLFWVF